MTDDPRNHYCEHPGCRAWGAFGFRLPGKPPRYRWYCAKHKIIKDGPK